MPVESILWRSFVQGYETIGVSGKERGGEYKITEERRSGIERPEY